MPSQDKSIVPFEKIQTSPFQKNTEADNILKRVERIASAVYLVTNHLSLSDTLVQRVRFITDEMIASVLDMKDGLFGNGEHARMSMTGRVRHLIALMQLLQVGGFVSQKNVMVLIEALDALGEKIAQGRPVHGVQIEREEMVVADREMVQISRSSKTVQEKNTSSYVFEKDTHTPPKVVVVSETKKKRTQTIMDTLSKDTLLGIKDICNRFPEYSEKMVQRELAQLVEEGIARKVGEKRWSRYGLLA